MLHITGDCHLPADLLLPHTVPSTYYLSFLCCVWVTSMKGIDRSLSPQNMPISHADTLLPSWSMTFVTFFFTDTTSPPHSILQSPLSLLPQEGPGVRHVCKPSISLQCTDLRKWGQWRELEGSTWSHCSSAGLLNVLTRPVPTGKLH